MKSFGLLLMADIEICLLYQFIIYDKMHEGEKLGKKIVYNKNAAEFVLQHDQSVLSIISLVIDLKYPSN